MELKDFMEERVVNILQKNKTKKKSETWLKGNAKKDKGRKKSWCMPASFSKIMHVCMGLPSCIFQIRLIALTHDESKKYIDL